MLFDRFVDLIQRERGKAFFHIAAVIRDSIVTAVESIAEAGGLGLEQHIDKFEEELPGAFEIFFRQSFSDELIIFVKRVAQREQALGWGNRTNPDLKDLLLPREVRVRLKLEHPAREIFDIRVISVVEAAGFAQTLVKMAIAGAMLPKVRSHQGERRIIWIAALHINGKPERKGS